MASRTRRRNGGGERLGVSALALLLVSRVCIGRTVDRTLYEHATAPAATAPAAPSGATVASHDAVQGPSREAMSAGVFDFSFGQLRSEAPLPDMIQAAGQLQQQVLSPPPLALSLRECSLGDAGVAELAKSPWACGATAVRSLSLRQNQVTAVGARALLDALRAPGSGDRLSSLELDFNPLGDAGVQPLPAYLKERAARGGGGLEELSLRFCDVGPAGCRYIASALLKSAAAAKAAAAEDGDKPFSPDPTADGAERDAVAAGREKEEGGDGVVLGVSPPPASGIRRLLLTGNHRLGAAGARALASALKKDGSLEVLDLTRCKIGDEGARCLADALRSNSSLRELRLGYNDISADGASALASLLHAGSSALDTLELQGNRVGDAGATALANGLAGAGKRGRRGAEQGGPAAAGLRSLNLAGNGIGCAGGVALAKALSGERSGRGSGSGGGGGGGGGGCALEELELAGNALTLSASQAAQAKKNSSLYKSAGGALSSLLNTFVDESYYSRGAPSGQDGGGSAAAPPSSSLSPLGLHPPAVPRRCAIAELGNALAGGGGGRSGSRPPRVKAVGLGRTGLTDKDASRLAATLRARPLDSPLQEVEVGMNMLSARASEAVREAVESPTGPDAGDFNAGGGRRQQQPQRQRQQQQPQRRRRRQSGSGRRDATAPVNIARRSQSQSKPRSRAGKAAAAAAAADDKRAARGEARGAGKELDVEVFGKRVRFERPPTSPARSPLRPPPAPSAMDESDYEPWSEDGDEVDLGEVSAAATDGSAYSSSWSEEEEEEKEEEEEERWNKGDDDSDGDGTDGGENGGYAGMMSSGSRSSGGRDTSSPAMEVRGGGGSGGGGGGDGGENPAGRRLGRQRQRQEGDQDNDGGEWSAGFETLTSEKDDDGAGENHSPGGGEASADKSEWEAGFDDERAARGEVGEYIPPGGSVELGMFGKKLVSFGQARGAGKELDVEVFGKRVRFERPPTSPARSPLRPPPAPSAMDESDYEPWSEDGDEVDLGEVSAAATDGSAYSSSWSEEEEEEKEEEEEERWNEGDDDSDGDGTDGGENGGYAGMMSSGSRSSSGGQGTSPPAMEMRGAGRGGEKPTEQRLGRQYQRQEGDQDNDGGEWSAGFETLTSEKEDDGADENHSPGGGGASADKIEWEAGFDEERRQLQDEPFDHDGDNDEARSAGCEPPVSQATGRKDDENAGAGGAPAEKAKGYIGMAGVLQGGTGGAAEWSAGFGSVGDDPEGSHAAGGGAASADKMEWDAGFDESDLAALSRREGAAERGEDE